LALWSNQCFEHIRVLVGTLVEVDEGTVSKEVLEYARLHIRIPLREETRLMKIVRINDRFCEVSFEEESFIAPSCGYLFHKWGMVSKEDSEAHFDANVGEDFSESECSDHNDRSRERRGEDKTV